MSPSFATSVSVGMICLGALGLYFVGQRRFNRLNELGVQVFRSYLGLLLTRLFEGTVRLLAILILTLGFGGLVAFAPRALKEQNAAGKSVAATSQSMKATTHTLSPKPFQ